MQKFQSSLLKIHAVCEQQSRLAEMELARALGQQHLAEQRVIDADAALEAARTAASQAMRQPLGSSLLHGVHHLLAVAAERLEQARTDLQKAAEQVQSARSAYQAIRTKVDSLSRLLEQQRSEYRKEVFKNQQNVMDDGSIFRWNGTPPLDAEVTSHG